MYIYPEAVDETLSFVSKNSGKGSSIIFDYTYHDVVIGNYDRREAKEWLRITKKHGEPLLFGIGIGELEQFLSERGFCNIKNVTSNYFSSNYFVGINKGRESTPILSIAHAEIRNQWLSARRANSATSHIEIRISITGRGGRGNLIHRHTQVSRGVRLCLQQRYGVKRLFLIWLVTFSYEQWGQIEPGYLPFLESGSQ